MWNTYYIMYAIHIILCNTKNTIIILIIFTLYANIWLLFEKICLLIWHLWCWSTELVWSFSVPHYLYNEGRTTKLQYSYWSFAVICGCEVRKQWFHSKPGFPEQYMYSINSVNKNKMSLFKSEFQFILTNAVVLSLAALKIQEKHQHSRWQTREGQTRHHSHSVSV